MKKTCMIMLALAAIGSVQARQDVKFKAFGDETTLQGHVLTCIPAGAAGYMGVLNSAYGIEEGGLVRNAVYYNSEISRRFKGRQATTLQTAVYWQGVEEATFWIRRSPEGPNLWEKTCKADELGRIVDPDAEEVIYEPDGSATVIDYEGVIDVPCDWVVDGESFFIGQDLQLRAEYGGIHAYVCSPCYTQGHWYFSASPMAGWEDMTGNGGYVMQLVTKDAVGAAKGLISNDVSLTSLATVRGKCGEKVQASVGVANYGANTVSRMVLRYTIEGKSEEFTVNMDKPMPYGASCLVPFEITLPSDAKRAPLTVSVVSVNDAPDAFTEGNEVTGAAVATKEVSEGGRTILFENLSAIWQSDEPYAIMSMERIKEKYGDQVVFVDAHYGQTGKPDAAKYDPLHCQDYAGLRERLFKIPYCYVNRVFEGDPFYGSDADYMAGKNGIMTVVNDFATQAPEVVLGGDVDVTDDFKTLKIRAEVTFTADIQDASEYMLGYIITEDGLEATQRNIYAGNDMLFSWFEEMGLNKLPAQWTRTFNDVAREAKHRYGIRGTLSGPAKAGLAQDVMLEHDIDFACKDLTKVHVVMLALESSSGEVMAAAKLPMLPTVVVPEGIAAITDSATSQQQYDLAGRPVAQGRAAKGIYIKAGRKIMR